MNIKDIQSVLAVASYKSFTEAAYSLSYTPSAVSKHVFRVEQELGVELFDRSKKQSEIISTENGEKLLEILERIEMEYKMLTALAERMRREADGRQILKIGVVPLIGSQGEWEVLTKFSEGNPQISVEQTTAELPDLAVMLQKGRLDGAFIPVIGKIDMKEFFRSRLGIENSEGIECINCMTCMGMSVGISDKHPLAQKKEVSLWDLRNEVFSFSNHQIANNALGTFLPRCKELGITPKIRTIDWLGQYVFRLTAEGKIVLPVSRVGLLYEGINFVHVTDWENMVTSVFISLKENHRCELTALKKCIKSMAAQDNEPEHTETAGGCA